ncbi:MAG: WXG100 family type VII secretion target, partial [Anaerolineae bacterium]|nr:WXG100 family type VII secretion target [Anaerolineae bacterium]
MTDVTQAQYDALQQIANHFDQQEGRVRRVMRDLQHQLDVLQNGAWDADAAHAYYQEMNNDVMPGVNKLVISLNRSSAVTLEIIRIFRAAEEESSSYWNEADSGGFAGGGLFGGVNGLIGGIGNFAAGVRGAIGGAITGIREDIREARRQASTNRLSRFQGRRIDGGTYGEDILTADVIMVTGIQNRYEDQDAALEEIKKAFGTQNVAGVYNESGRDSVPRDLRQAAEMVLTDGQLSSMEDIAQYFLGESTLNQVTDKAAQGAAFITDGSQSWDDITSALSLSLPGRNPAVDSIVDVLRIRSGQTFTLTG